MQNNSDNEQLNLLAIFFYIVGAITGLFACIPIIHLVLGILLIVAPEELADANGDMPPKILGVLFAAIGGLMVTLGWATAICIFLAGRFIARRTHWMFCVVVSAIACIFMPFGTVLGIFALIVLNRPSVRELFENGGELPVDAGGFST